MPSEKTARVRAQLLTAQNKKLIVQFERPFERGSFTGYVMGVGPKFFLLASLNDGFEFEQYTFLRIADIRRLECPAKRVQFYTKVRKLRGDKFPPRLRINLADLASILDSMPRSLITFLEERVNPDSCKIGYMLSRSKAAVELLEIDARARWAMEPTHIKFNKITRIDLPGPYENALLLAGGEPPIPSKR